MKLAIDRQLKRFAQKNMNGTIKLGTKVYPLTKMKDTLVHFKKMIADFETCKSKDLESNCFRDLNQEIKQKFAVYIPDLKPEDPRYGEAETALFTGYHTMPIEGKRAKDAAFAHAVYGNPGDPKLFFSRTEIDFQNKLAGRGLELLYTKSLFDIYLLHVQGSGKATILNPDGTKSGYYLNYDGTNKQKWEWISKYMFAKGYITNTSIPAQRKFLRKHPELQEEIFNTCPSYVFSRLTTEPPMGSDNVPVTDARSIAQDSGLYAFKGLLAYVETTRPLENGNYDLDNEDWTLVQYRKFQRFFIDQDTGGAIKGKARADIYFGEDLYAQYSAGNMKQTGKIYFMMLK
jgi:membrane-bound lytic murein transglycosylase A